jgi:hypothetical protein
MTDHVMLLTERIEDILIGRGAPVVVGLDGRCRIGRCPGGRVQLPS